MAKTEFDEYLFKCDNPACTHTEWHSYQDDSRFLPGICPICRDGDLIESDETRVVQRAPKTFIDGK